MGNANLYFGGLPTEFDIKKLSDHFGKPEIGVIPYEEIETVIGQEWKSARFSLIVKNWRKALLRELNIDSQIDPGKGVRILTAVERIDASHKDLKSGIRKTRKSNIRILSIPVVELDDVSRKKYDHVARYTLAIFLASTVGEKELTAALKMPAPLPRIAPPQKAEGHR